MIASGCSVSLPGNSSPDCAATIFSPWPLSWVGSAAFTGLLITQLLISLATLLWPAWLSSYRIQCKIHNQWKSRGMWEQRPMWYADPKQCKYIYGKQKHMIFNGTYIFGSQELHAFGHLVGKAEQVGCSEALIHVVWQQVVHLTLWFRKHTHVRTQRKHDEADHKDMFITYCKYSTGCSSLAFTNGREKLDIIMFVLQLSSPCNYRVYPKFWQGCTPQPTLTPTQH